MQQKKLTKEQELKKIDEEILALQQRKNNLDIGLEQIFKNAFEKANPKLQKISAKMIELKNEFKKNIEELELEATKISDEFGVPFKDPLFNGTREYYPESFAKFNGFDVDSILKEHFCYTSYDPGEIVGWESSSC